MPTKHCTTPGHETIPRHKNNSRCHECMKKYQREANRRFHGIAPADKKCTHDGCENRIPLNAKHCESCRPAYSREKKKQQNAKRYVKVGPPVPAPAPRVVNQEMLMRRMMRGAVV